MRIGLVVDHITQHKWENSVIEKEIRKRNFDCEVINIYNFPISTEKREWGIDVALARTATATHFRVGALRAIESSGVEVINSSECIRNGGDKYASLVMLHDQGLITPKTFMVFSFASAVKAISDLGTPVVLKPVFGTYGRGIFRVKSIEKEIHLLDGLEYPYIVQEYIPHPQGDIRVLVVDDKAIGAIKRIAPKDEWKTNVSVGAKSKKVKLNEELSTIARKAAQALNVKYAGVDLIKRKDEFVILEINTQPDFQGFYSTLGINPVDKIVELAVKNLENKKK